MTIRKQNTYDEIVRNANRLTVGQAYTYKQLCDILETPYTSHESKYAQLKILGTVVDYEKIKTRYRINGFKSKKQELIRNTRGSSAVNGDLALSIVGLSFNSKDDERISKYNEKEDSYQLHITTDRLLKDLNLIHQENYKKAKSDINRFANELDVEREIAKENTQNIYENNRKTIKRVLGTLHKARLIYYTENTLIKKRYIDVDVNQHDEIMLDKKGNAILLIDEDEEPRVATLDEEMAITSVKRNFLTNKGFKTEVDMLYHPNKDKLYAEMNELIEQELNITYCRRVHTIMFKAKDIINYLNKFGGVQDLDYYRNKVGDAFVENYKKNSLNRHKNAIKKVNENKNLIDIESDEYNRNIALRVKDNYKKDTTIVHNALKPSSRDIVFTKARKVNNTTNSITNSTNDINFDELF